MSDADIGAQLAAWGKVALIDTRGRRTGLTARAAVGFIEEPDGSILVAAGDPNADWALNLELEPACQVTIGDVVTERVAEPLDRAATNAAVTALILRYGTPAERLGRGAAFRLRLATGGATSSVADRSIPSDDIEAAPREPWSGYGKWPWPQRDGPMDPFGTLIVSLGTLLVLDIAALKLGASSRRRPRARASFRQR